MKRYFSFILIFLLVFSTILPSVHTVSAASEGDIAKVYADGEYELPFEVWQADKDEISVADGYLEKPATLTIKDGKYTVEATLKNSSWWQYFKVASGDEFIDVTEVSKNEEEDTVVVQFEVDDIDEILDAKVHIIVTGIPGFEYDNKYDIRFNFDTSDIPLASEEQPGNTADPGNTHAPDATDAPGDPDATTSQH